MPGRQSRTSNFQHRTSNVDCGIYSKFNVGCSMFDVFQLESKEHVGADADGSVAEDIESATDSNVKSDDNFIPVVHHVVFADRVIQVGGLHFPLRPQAQQVVHRHDFGADETAGEIAMDRTCGVEGV